VATVNVSLNSVSRRIFKREQEEADAEASADADGDCARAVAREAVPLPSRREEKGGRGVPDQMDVSDGEGGAERRAAASGEEPTAAPNAASLARAVAKRFADKNEGLVEPVIRVFAPHTEALVGILEGNRSRAAAATGVFRRLCSDVERGLDPTLVVDRPPEDGVAEEVAAAVRAAIIERRQARDAHLRSLTKEYARLLATWKKRMKQGRDKRSRDKRESCRERDRFLFRSVHGEDALLSLRTSSGRTSTKVLAGVTAGGLPLSNSAEIDVALAEIDAAGGTPGAEAVWSRTLASIPEQNAEVPPLDCGSVLIEDPVAMYTNACAVNPWSREETLLFLEKFLLYHKNFRRIATFLDNKSASDTVRFYYGNKLRLNLKQLVLKRKGMKRAHLLFLAGLRRHPESSRYRPGAGVLSPSLLEGPQSPDLMHGCGNGEASASPSSGPALDLDGRLLADLARSPKRRPPDAGAAAPPSKRLRAQLRSSEPLTGGGDGADRKHSGRASHLNGPAGAETPREGESGQRKECGGDSFFAARDRRDEFAPTSGAVGADGGRPMEGDPADERHEPRPLPDAPREAFASHKVETEPELSAKVGDAGGVGPVTGEKNGFVRDLAPALVEAPVSGIGKVGAPSTTTPTASPPDPKRETLAVRASAAPTVAAASRPAGEIGAATVTGGGPVRSSSLEELKSGPLPAAENSAAMPGAAADSARNGEGRGVASADKGGSPSGPSAGACSRGEPRPRLTALWTPQDQALFKELFEKHDRDWKKVAPLMTPKTPAQIKGFWRKMTAAPKAPTRGRGRDGDGDGDGDDSVAAGVESVGRESPRTPAPAPESRQVRDPMPGVAGAAGGEPVTAFIDTRTTVPRAKPDALVAESSQPVRSPDVLLPNAVDSKASSGSPLSSPPASLGPGEKAAAYASMAEYLALRVSSSPPPLHAAAAGDQRAGHAAQRRDEPRSDLPADRAAGVATRERWSTVPNGGVVHRAAPVLALPVAPVELSDTVHGGSGVPRAQPALRSAPVGDTTASGQLANGKADGVVTTPSPRSTGAGRSVFGELPLRSTPALPRFRSMPPPPGSTARAGLTPKPPLSAPLPEPTKPGTACVPRSAPPPVSSHTASAAPPLPGTPRAASSSRLQDIVNRARAAGFLTENPGANAGGGSTIPSRDEEKSGQVCDGGANGK
jgi:hypothetical protein